MVSRCIVDTSAAAAWAFQDEQTPQSRSFLKHVQRGDLVVPAIWPAEILNMLRVAERRARISHSEVSRFLRLVRQLNVQIDDPTRIVRTDAVIDTARRFNLTAYDACYLELAVRVHLPLVTRDAELLQASTLVGVETYRI